MNARELPTTFFAGFFDADGYVGISKGNGTSYYLLTVAIVQVKREILDLFVQEFGGKVTGPHIRKGRGRPIYQWVAEAKVAERFLREVSPYLVVKRERAQMAIDFRVLFRGENIIPRGHGSQNDRNRQKAERIKGLRHEYYLSMKRLNQRGVA
jgi:hypothetical protein